MARGKRPDPFRTRKLSLSAPMVLPRRRGGRVGRRRTTTPMKGPHHTVRALHAFREKPPLQDGHSAASARLPCRRPDVVGQPRVEPGQIPPGGPDLLERPALLQPVGGLPVSARVQRLVPEQVGAFAIAFEAGGHPHEPLAVDGPPGRGQPVHLALESRTLHLVGDRPAVPGHLVGLQSPATSGDHQPVGRHLHVPGTRATAGGVDDRSLVGLVRRLVVAEAHVPVGPEQFGAAELARQLVEQRLHGRPHALVVHRTVAGPVDLAVVGLEALVEDQPLVGEALERHRFSSASSSSVCQRTSRSGVPPVSSVRTQPSLAQPADSKKPADTLSASGSQTCSRAVPSARASWVPATSRRLPCPRRPHRGSTSRVATSPLGPAGSGRSSPASSAGPYAAKPTTRSCSTATRPRWPVASPSPRRASPTLDRQAPSTAGSCAG